MKNITNFLFFKKFLLISLLFNKIKNSEQFKELCLKLLVLFGFNKIVIHPNLIGKGIALRFDTLNMNLFLDL